jgi:hypothetical protein
MMGRQGTLKCKFYKLFFVVSSSKKKDGVGGLNLLCCPLLSPQIIGAAVVAPPT